MNHIIGSNVGNALEIQEVWSYFTAGAAQRDPELHDLVKRVCVRVLMQNGMAATPERNLMKP